MKRCSLLFCALLVAGCGPGELDTEPQRGSNDPPPRCEVGGSSRILAEAGALTGAEHWDCQVPPTFDEAAARFASITGVGSVVNGGSVRLVLALADGNDASGHDLLVAASNESGYYVLASPPTAPGGTIPFDLFIAPTAHPGELSLRFAIEDGSGEPGALHPGPWTTLKIKIIEVKGGDIQVNINWLGDSDVDLYVQDPNQEVISFGHRAGTTGGALDLDSNAMCSAGPSNENIYWPEGRAPAGEYGIGVNLYSACTAHEAFPFRLSVLLSGVVVDTLDGTLSPQEADGTVHELARFTWPPP